MSDRRLKVLLVDDELEFLDILSTRLQARGLQVETAASGLEAIAKAQDPSFDAILLDLAMPGMDGLETLGGILGHDPSHQIIILTGHATLEKGMEAIKIGALDMLEKPVPLSILMDKIEEAAKRKQRMAEVHPPRPVPSAGPSPSPGPARVPILHRVLPFLAWIGQSRGAAMRADALSGLTVALVLIPQSMAYAQLAGLPAYYGLYAAFLPPVIASLFGSSRQLSTGPVAVVSLMTAAALEPLASAGSAQYVAYAIVLALLVGIFQFLLGVLKLGLVVNFLSHPVVNGFTNAAALIIATSQLSKIFGVEVDSAPHHYETVVRVIEEATRSTHWPTVGMATIAFVLMIGIKRLSPRFPCVLVAVAITTVLAWATGFDQRMQVPLESVQSAEVTRLVTDFNAAVNERSELEHFRTTMNKRREEIFLVSDRVCTRCHERRPIRMFGGARVPAPSATTPTELLLLHHSGDLLDDRIREIKEHEEPPLRASLRALRFEAPEGSAGPVRVIERTGADEGRWHLKVGSQPLDPGALPLRAGGDVVGVIPSGLPVPKVPHIDAAIALKLIPAAMIISILGFMEAISIAKAMAARTHQRLDPNQELIGQGLANTVGSLFQSYAVSGSFSRSAVNFHGGAVTGLSNVYATIVVVLTLLFFTPLLYHLPQAVLAAIIMMAVAGLINAHGVVHAWKAQPFDGLTAIVTFVVTLIFAPHLEWGIFTGVVLSLGAYLFRTMRPHVAMLAIHPDGSLRDAARHGLRQCPHIAALRFDGPLNFASCGFLEDAIMSRASEGQSLREVLIVAHGINEIDASGMEVLEKVVFRLRTTGSHVSFSGLKDSVIDALRRTRLWDKIGEENVYPTQLDALRGIYDRAHATDADPDCPLRPPAGVTESGVTRRPH